MRSASEALVAILDGTALRAPAPGWFHRAVQLDHLVDEGDVIGELDVLGRITRVIAPAVRGLAKLEARGTRRAVSYSDILLRVEPITELGALPSATRAQAAKAADDAHVFRAPTSGRFYGRAAPDKPPFVTAGSALSPGTTICLLEVMKTFHRVTYAGDPARVKSVLVGDGDDVDAGAPLLALEPG
jgi:acetyl-CoA carboxylase biotin carboxyl carrier protein